MRIELRPQYVSRVIRSALLSGMAVLLAPVFPSPAWEIRKPEILAVEKPPSKYLSVLEASRRAGTPVSANDLFRLNERQGPERKGIRPPKLRGQTYLPGRIGFDLVPGGPVFLSETGGEVVDDDRDFDMELTVRMGDEFSTVIRLNDTEDLLGITFDFRFDKNILKVVEMRETRMDLDFSGLQDPPEMEAIREFYESGDRNTDRFSYTYNDGTGNITTHPGVLMDFDGDGELSPYEFGLYEAEYQANLAGTDIPFWTEIVGHRPGFNESVEIFDTVADMNGNAGGTDNTVVLLRRPEIPAKGYGFDGDAILFEVRFQAIAEGDCPIVLENALGIDEMFTDINTDVLPIEAVTGPSVVHVSPAPDARMLLETIKEQERPEGRFRGLIKHIQTWMK